MERLYKDYPNDREASVFYALSLLTRADSEHPTVDSEKAIAILNVVFRDTPARDSSSVHVGAENQLHAMEFLEYAYLQIGEDKKAKEMVGAQAKIRYGQVDKNLHDYVNRTRANSPALYYLETRNCKAAEALRPDSGAETYNQAIIYWAQAVAAGHLRDFTTAEHAVTQYNALLEATKQGRARIELNIWQPKVTKLTPGSLFSKGRIRKPWSCCGPC